MEKQQTAIDWLINEIKIARKLCDDLSMEMDIWHTLDVLIAKEKQAKEMEKQQIEQALNDGKAMVLGNIENKSLEQYYNKTFKNN
jgi:predicted secreted protein